MPLLSSLRTGSATTFLAMCTTYAACAQDPRAIITRTNAVYAKARTYQATYQMDLTMGNFGSISQRIVVKAIPHRQASIISKINGKPTGQMATDSGLTNTQMVDNGKTMYTYMPDAKKYTKQPHMAATNAGGLAMLLPQLGDPKTSSGAYKLLAPATVNGRAAYVVEITDRSAPGEGVMQVYVDKATYHLLQVKIVGGASAQAPLRTMIVSLKNEKFNQPIPAKFFTFTPPQGATEMQETGNLKGAAAPKGH